MIRSVVNILSHFDESDFKDYKAELWESKFYNNTIVIYYGDLYIAIEDIFAITALDKKVKLNDMTYFKVWTV